MLEQKKRILFRISSVLCKVEPEPDLHSGSGSDRLWLHNTAHRWSFFDRYRYRYLFFAGSVADNKTTIIKLGFQLF